MAIEQRAIETLTVADIQAQIDAADAGAEISLAPGRLRGRLVIDKAITLRGSGAGVTILDGLGAGPTIAVDAPKGEVFIEELTITGGSSSLGGGISIDNGGLVQVVGCMIERNSARNGRGGGIALDRGTLRVLESTLVRNEAQLGGGIYVGGDGSVQLATSIVAENVALRGGGVALIDGAALEVWTCRFEQNEAELEGHHLFCCGTRSRRPRAELANAMLGRLPTGAQAITNHRAARAMINIDHSTLGRELPPSMVG